VTKYHLNRSLGEIAREIAGKYGLGVAGAPSGITLANVYQDGDDLGFLRRLADRYGYSFKVAHGSLVFFRVKELEARQSVFELSRDKVTQYSFRSSGEPVCKSVELKYYDPTRKGLVSGTANNSTAVVGEKVRLDVRCSSPAELQDGADAEMDRRKREEDEISVTRVGEPLLIAGVVVTVKGFGVFDRQYLVKESLHSWTRVEGYTTEVKLQTKTA
jgi:phage protein D